MKTLRSRLPILIAERQIQTGVKITQKELALATGLTEATLSRLMNATETKPDERWTVEKAEAEFLRRLRSMDPEDSDDKPRIATTLCNLAWLYHENQRLEEAERNYRKALDLYHESYGRNHEYVATALNNLGSLYREMGQFRVAAHSILRALEINRNLFGEENAQTAATLNNLGAVCESLEFRKRAEVLYRRAYVIFRNTLGPNSSEACAARVNMRRASLNQGTWMKPLITWFRRLRVKVPSQRL